MDSPFRYCQTNEERKFKVKGGYRRRDMEINVEKRRAYTFIIDNEKYTTFTLADRVGINRCALLKSLNSNMAVSNEACKRYIEELFFKSSNNISMIDSVYRNKQGCMFAVALLIRYVPGLKVSAGRDRLARWRDGALDNDGLFLPARLGASGVRVANRVGVAPTAVTREIQRKILLGSQPRKTVEQLGKGGTWETENCKQQDFTKCGKHNQGHNTSGHYYTGD